MSTNNESSDGGPAFPRPVSHSVEGGTHRGCLGMSLRDYFAGQALAGRNVSRAYETWADMAVDCYEIADHMLAAREAKQ